jgi:hypothetical protein
MNVFPSAINDPALSGAERLAALRRLEAETRKGAAAPSGETNNHIHTVYSFSPYTPAMAALRARDAGLAAAGSVDHDSIAAAGEMLEACALLGIGGCVGFEVRAGFKTGAEGMPGPFARRKLNNPDSEGIAYMTVQGIPKSAIPEAAEFLKPVRTERLGRTRAMTVSVNALLREAGLGEIDFDRDIYDTSRYAEGGEITERHLLAAVAEKLVLKYGKGPELAEALVSKMGVSLSPKLAAFLSDPENPHYLYDLLGVLKPEFLPKVFIQPGERECIPAERVTAFAASIAAIPAYAYLGDVKESPTGDKKAEKFEDDYMEELFAELSRLGFLAVTCMPPRNTPEQLARLRQLSAGRGFMEISGVDINSSRQSFNCPEVLRPEFRHLLDSAWALIAHERLASVDRRCGLFSEGNPLGSLTLGERLAAYAGFGRKLDLHHPDESAANIVLEIQKGRL